MKRYRFIGAIALILVFLLVILTKQTVNKPQASSSLSPTSMVVATTPGENSLCHAQYINQNDPQAVLPDSKCTPGVLNLQVTQTNIQETICKSGYSASIRPPVSYTNKLKREQIVAYGFTDTNPKDYEEDHFISLELGGNPTDPKNLWAEPHSSPNEKDKVENYLHKQVCSGAMTLIQVQEEITNNWYKIYLNLENKLN